MAPPLVPRPPSTVVVATRHVASLRVVILLMATWAAACGDVLVEPGPEDTPVQNFEELWRTFDRHYAHFVLKDVDWAALRATHRPRVDERMPPESLFAVLCDLIRELRDGHVNLFTPFGSCGYAGWFEPYPHNFFFDFVQDQYLQDDHATAAGGLIRYGRLASGIGYLHIAAFGGTGWTDAVDSTLRALSPLRGLVVDVRDNGGGRTDNAEAVAGRFTEGRRLFAFVRYRNGPRHGDLTEPLPRYVEPAGEVSFTGPVAVLTNRRCFSACEHFVLALRGQAHVTVVGDTTGGGFGSPLYRELPNGWTYRLPVWLETTAEDVALEGIGIAPDVPAEITERDLFFGLDPILQAGIDAVSATAPP